MTAAAARPPSLLALRRRLRAGASAERARFVAGYFKTGPGEYGEGDRFLGATMPAVRALAKAGAHLPLGDVSVLLQSPWHEERSLGVLILVRQFARADAAGRRRILRFYLRWRRRINNWDLVDISAPQILGPFIRGAEGRRIRALETSPLVWDRRMAVLASFHEIAHGRHAYALGLASRLLGDEHDLVHKAVGWMLREVCKRDEAAARAFLDRHAAVMPRTMLSYAIERLPPSRQRHYLARRAAVARRQYSVVR